MSYDHAVHIRLLENVNNAQTEFEHTIAETFLMGWRAGVESMLGRSLNYLPCDMHYINLGVERPMCCGVFLDWVPAPSSSEEEK